MKISEKDIVIIRKILAEIDYLSKSVQGLNRDSFLKNEDKKRIVSMTLINIGELTRHVSMGLKEQVTDIPFRRLLDLRNIAAHGYHSLKFDHVWYMIESHVPQLKVQLQKLIAEV